MDPKLDPGLFSLVTALRLMMRSQGFGRLAFMVAGLAGSETEVSEWRERTVRRITQNTVFRVPLDTRFCKMEGANVRNVEKPVPRIWPDSVGRGSADPLSFVSWMASASALALLRARRPFRGRERNGMSSFGWGRWWRDNK